MRMWLFPGFGLFVGILPFLFIFLVLKWLVRRAPRCARDARRPLAGPRLAWLAGTDGGCAKQGRAHG